MNSTSSKNSRIERAVHGSSRHRSLVLLLSVVVVLITAYFLILPALTLEKEEAQKQGGISVAHEAAADQSSQALDSGKLTYEGKSYDVEASFDEGAQIPKYTRLRVMEIGKDNKHYKEYYNDALKAVQENTETEVSSLSFAKFYDIALRADATDVEPADSVDVRISYNKGIKAEDADHVRIVHFKEDPKSGEIEPELLKPDDVDVTIEKDKMTEAAFKADSFSVYAIVYTVDFEYTDEETGQTYQYNLKGGDSIKLSELFEALGVKYALKDTTEKLTGAELAKHVESVAFSDTSLVTVTKNSLLGDWVLQSLKAFDTNETLTVSFDDGGSIIINVTDTQESTDLSNFLQNVVISGATQNPDGAYQVESGTEYTMILSFAEDSNYQFDNDQTLTYQMPEGIQILSEQTGNMNINIVYSGRTYQVPAHYVLNTDGLLSITFDQNDPDYPRLEESTNVSFRFTYTGEFDGHKTKIKFAEDIERDIVFTEPDAGQVYVSKTGEFDENTGKWTYTITVNATGNVTNVRVKDVISGDALIFNNDVTVTGNSSTYTDNHASNGFDYTFASMREGETITITYTANTDFSKDTDKNGKLTVDQTKNTVTVQPDNGDPHTAEYSREITFKSTNKSNGTEAGVTGDGKKIIEWTIDYNPLALASAAGDTITDSISPGSREYMKYYGDGISVAVYDHSGNLVDTRNINYTALTAHSDSSWTYTIPNSDTTPYHYVITYKTIVDMTEIEQGAVTVSLSNTANNSTGSVNITPHNLLDITKRAESFTTEEVTWVSTLFVPEGGLAQAVVTDSFPSIWLDSKHYDVLKTGSLEIQGLLPGESYDEPVIGTGNVVITFYKDSGKTQTGLQGTAGGHTITVRLTTKVDQEWLQKGYETGGYEQNHTNTIDINGKSATATVTFGEPGITKEGARQSNGSFKYTVVLAGVSSLPVSVNDVFNTNLLEVDRASTNNDHMKIYGGNQYWQGSGETSVSYVDTPTGITLTANSVPTQPDGNYYPYYKIVYYLKLKEGVDLEELAIANGGQYNLTNTAHWNGHDNTYTYKVKYDSLDKQLLNAGELGGTNRKAQYQITFNSRKATLNNGEPMEMTDVLSANLSIDYSSIRITTDPAGITVPYSLRGGENGTTVATYTVPDSTKVVITYDADVRGNGDQEIVNKVTVNGEEETIQTEKSYGSASEGEGAIASFKIVKVDGYDANKKLQGVTFKIFAENPTLDFGVNAHHDKELLLTTDENGEIILNGAVYDFYFNECYHIREVKPLEDYGTISFDYLVTLTNDMAHVDYGHYIYYYSDTMQIKNWPLEGLIVEKQVDSDDSADKDRYYTFRVSILNDDGSVNTDYNEKNGDDQFVNGVRQFQLKDKEQKMFWGFTKGTKYKVEEIDADGFAVSVKYSVFNEQGTVTEIIEESGTSHTGTLTQSKETILFTNSRQQLGSLKLKKNVTVNGESVTEGEASPTDGTYTFTVTKDTPPLVNKTVTVTFENGTITAATVDGETVSVDDGFVYIENLPLGTYTVTEAEPDNGTVLVGDNNKQIQVTAGTTDIPVVTFTNNYETPKIFEFYKEWQGSEGIIVWPTDTDGKKVGIKVKVGRKVGEEDDTAFTLEYDIGGSSNEFPEEISPKNTETPKLKVAIIAGSGSDIPAYRFSLEGLASKDAEGHEYTYYVKETDYPEGYEFLHYETGGQIIEDIEGSAQNGGKIVNVSEESYELPLTGGSGTSRNYVLGFILTAGAGVLLLRRRRRLVS